MSLRSEGSRVRLRARAVCLGQRRIVLQRLRHRWGGYKQSGLGTPQWRLKAPGSIWRLKAIGIPIRWSKS